MTAATATPVPTGPIPERIDFVTFVAPASTNVRPTVHSLPWPEMALRLTCHTEAATKDVMGWSPAVYRRDTRGRLLTRRLDAVDAVTCAVADVEHITLDALAELLEHVRALGLAGVVYSTHSHSSTEPRVRLVVPFSDPVPAETWRRLWPALNERIYLGLADRAASDASRMYYLPSTPGDETTIADRWDGAALDWRALPLADTAEHPSSPVATTGRGAATTVLPEDMTILERMFGGRDGERLMRLWAGDYRDYDGDASRADMRLVGAVTFYAARDTARIERIMRAGPHRPKWDEPRGATTWLGYTIGKAIASCRETYAPPDAGPEPPEDEALEVKVARLERENRQLRAAAAVQMTNLRAERAGRDAATTTVRRVFDILAVPKEQMTADFKVATLVTLLEAHSRASRGVDAVPVKTLAARAGSSEDKMGANLRDLAARDGSPIQRRVTRAWVKDDLGQVKPITVTEVLPRHPDVNAGLAAVLEMGGPSSDEQRRKQKDRDRAERSRTWGRCPHCPNVLVAVTGKCPKHGAIVGERLLTVTEFCALNPGIRDSRTHRPLNVNDSVVNVPVFRDSGSGDAVAPPLPGFRDSADESPPIAPRSHIARAFRRFPPPAERPPAVAGASE